MGSDVGKAYSLASLGLIEAEDIDPLGFGAQKRGQQQAAALQQEQVREAGEIERLRIEREAAAIRGRQIALQAEGGLDLGTSILQTALDRTLNLETLQTNIESQIQQSQANLGVNLAALRAQRTAQVIQIGSSAAAAAAGAG